MQNEKTLKQEVYGGMLWSIFGSYSVQILSFGLSIFLARLLSPTDYGLLGMTAIFIAISKTFVDSGMGLGLIRKKDATNTDFSTVFYFNIIVATICYFLLFFSAPFVADFFNQPQLLPILRIISLTLIIGSLGTVHFTKLTKEMNFKLPAKINIISVIISGPIGVFLAWKGFGVWALVNMTLTQYICQTVMVWLFHDWRPTFVFNKTSFKELFGFGSKILLSGLLDQIFANLNSAIIGKKFLIGDLGLYTQASRLKDIVFQNLYGVLSKVSYPAFAKITDDEQLKYSYRKALRLMSFILFPVFAGLIAVAKPMILVLLTAKWEGMIVFFQLLCVGAMFYPIHAINLNVILVKGFSNLFLKIEIIKKTLVVLVLFITIPIGINAMLWGEIVTSLIALFINTYYSGKFINYNIWEQLKDLSVFVIAASCMGLVVWCLSLILWGILPLWLILVLQIILGILVYICIVKIAKVKEMKESIQIIKELKVMLLNRKK